MPWGTSGPSHFGSSKSQGFSGSWQSWWVKGPLVPPVNTQPPVTAKAFQKKQKKLDQTVGTWSSHIPKKVRTLGFDMFRPIYHIMFAWSSFLLFMLGLHTSRFSPFRRDISLLGLHIGLHLPVLGISSSSFQANMIPSAGARLYRSRSRNPLLDTSSLFKAYQSG